MRLLIRGGRVLDPAQGVDGALDILIENGKIVQTGQNLNVDSAQVLDAGRLLSLIHI